MVKVPPPVWALLYILIALGVSRMLGWPKVPGLHLTWLGVALVCLAFATAVSAFTLFRREGTELDPASETNKKLVVAGPYRFTRNPMYLSLIVLTLGIAIWTALWPMFAVPVLVFLTAARVHIPFEEAKMRRFFGEDYDAFCRRVRRWL